MACTVVCTYHIQVWSIALFICPYGIPEPPKKINEQLHTFFCTNPSFGVGDMMINVMDNLEQNITDFISKVPKGCIFDAHSVISYLLKNHTDDYLEFHNDAEPTNSFHSRVSRAINPFVDKNIIKRIDAKSYSQNIRGNFSENSCWRKL